MIHLLRKRFQEMGDRAYGRSIFGSVSHPLQGLQSLWQRPRQPQNPSVLETNEIGVGRDFEMFFWRIRRVLLRSFGLAVSDENFFSLLIAFKLV